MDDATPFQLGQVHGCFQLAETGDGLESRKVELQADHGRQLGGPLGFAQAVEAGRHQIAQGVGNRGTGRSAGIALFVFRWRRPDLPRPYRCWGYPVVPLVFVASALLLAVNTVREQPVETLAGVGILVLGLPFYLAMRYRARTRP